MPARSLADWLSDLEQRGPAPIALGLERIAEVYRRLELRQQPKPLVFTVAGTNGKGSTVAYIDSVLRAAGLRVGRYTSPHLCHYAERIVIDGEMVSEQAIVDAFARIDRARGDIELTYFEFGTLAALQIFNAHPLRAWVLEVGLGGRLDAVNIVDPDVAVITSIDLDHQQYLGNDRDSIGAEKAGILRTGVPAVIGDPDPPPSVLARAAELGAALYLAGRDFALTGSDQAELHWQGPQGDTLRLPQSPLPGAHQRQNLATAIAALWCARDAWPWSPVALRSGIAQTRLAGRLQPIRAHCACYVDVAHNPDSARALAAWLRTQQRPGRRIRAVFSLYADKDLHGVLEPLRDLVEYWAIAPLVGPRALPIEEIAAAIAPSRQKQLQRYPSIAAAFRDTLTGAASSDLVIAFGSFVVAEQVLRVAQTRPSA